MPSSFLTDKKPDFEKAIEFFRQELGSLRGGRASPALVEEIPIEAYGSSMPLKAVASIAIPDPKTISIEPWDANLVKDIERGIIAANLGMSPVVQGKLIRLVMPPMTEERRKQFIKILKEKAEDARKTIRAVRESVRNEIIEMEANKEITEDDRFRLQDELDKLTKQFTDALEKTVAEKEEEIMTV